MLGNLQHAIGGIQSVRCRQAILSFWLHHMNEWVLAAHRSELSSPGDYVALPVGEQGIAVFNHCGEIVAIPNSCPHRGNRLFDGMGNRLLVCGYHGWGAAAIVSKAIRYLTAWVGDWLFVGDGSVRLDLQLGGIEDALAVGARISRHSFDVIPMACDWTVAVENALEDLHVPHVHPETIGKLGLELVEQGAFGKNSLALYTITNERIVKQLAPFATSPDSYFHLLIYPWTCLSSVGGLTYSLQHYFPNGAATTLTTRLYGSLPLSAGGDDAVGFLYEQARAFNKRTFEEDAAICSRVSGRGYHLMPGEDRIRWFRAAHGTP